jgi:hypothetical protein
MGTSSSYRSPNTPRWRVFNRALDEQLPLERLRVQLFLAGESDWRQALDAPALATFAETLLEAHATLGERLAGADRPAPVLAAVVSSARNTLFDEDYTAALPVAERALRIVLIDTAQGDKPVADATGAEAAEAWTRNRGDASTLLGRYVSELFGQWAAHVASRDTARLVGLEGGPSIGDVRALADRLSNAAAAVAGTVPVSRPEAIGEHWQSLIAAVFAAGCELGVDDGA